MTLSGPTLMPKIFGLRLAHLDMAPRADDEIMVRLGAGMFEMLAMEFERAGLVAVIDAAHRQDRDGQVGELLRGRVGLVPIGILHRMLHPFVPRLGGEAEKLRHLAEGQAGLEEAQEFRLPEGAVIIGHEAAGMAGDAGQEGRREVEEDIVAEREVEPDEAGRGRHDRRQIWHRRVPRPIGCSRNKTGPACRPCRCRRAA